MSLDDSLSTQLTDYSSSGSSDDDACFTNDNARHVYDEWLKVQPKSSLKTMAIMIMDMFLDRFPFTVLGASNEVGLLLGLNEKTVRTWRKDFYSNQVFLLSPSGASILEILFSTTKSYATKQHCGFIKTLP